ncbi:DUF4397 domain-containing protein [Alkalihalobacillus oceani]|uniref:DUF4397 domain-containing protein n=1 Tax=Halalkalibacter oceani TaxID=1653776 RepID=UPI00204089F7|nr:DUF4397 domain-containing protein [Halalkalibacter oceani]MCM3763175.1 DUF4397 domain-containing protein [Halalkalibacter oceani]
MKKAGVVVLLLLVLAMGAPVYAETEAQARVVHATPDAPKVDVYLDKVLVVEGLEFTEAGQYLSLSPGMHTFSIFPAGDTDAALVTDEVTVEAGQYYTLAAIGEVEAMSIAKLVDDQTTSAGKTKLRVAHFSPLSPALSVATAEGEVLFPELIFPTTAAYLEVAPGSYSLEIKEPAALLELVETELKADTVYTALAVGSNAGEEQLTVILLTDYMPLPADLPKTGLGGASPTR